MNKNGPVVIVEDDPDDQHVLAVVFKELDYPNEVVFFDDGVSALEYLRKDRVLPFLILCDINMPRLNGFELIERVQKDADLSYKCIPFLFLTTSTNAQAVRKAYKLSAQGLFVKPIGYERMRDTISLMMQYWQVCCSPTRMMV